MLSSWVGGSICELDRQRGLGGTVVVRKFIWQVTARDTWSCRPGILDLVIEARRYPCHEPVATVLSGITYWEKSQLLSGPRKCFHFNSSTSASFPVDGKQSWDSEQSCSSVS